MMKSAQIAGLLTLFAAPCLGGGFSFFEHGTKATGMAGAFVAQADDPTAIFYNPGGLTLLEKDKLAIGVNVSSLNESLYQGLPPGIGTETTARQKISLDFPIHAFGVLELGEKAMLGVGIYSPFLLQTKWRNPDDFAGRFIAHRSEIDTWDLAPTIGFQLAPTFGIGVGAIYRISRVRANRRRSTVDPIGGGTLDVADVALESDMDDGIGWSFGALHKMSDTFSWGASYRSEIAVEHIGVTRLTQIPTGNDQLDALLRATLPFDQDIAFSSEIDYPGVATVGLAVGLSKAILVELDVNWTSWSSLQAITFRHRSNPDLNQTVALSFDDSLTYRLGLQYMTPTGIALRGGIAYDESPQPDETVGAFLPDADRTMFSVGVGLDWLEVGFIWSTYDQRIVSTSVDGLNGNYRKNSWLIGITVSQ